MFARFGTNCSDKCTAPAKTACLSWWRPFPPDARARLALFCYRRSHLHSLALAIAASCSEQELAHFGGRAGSTLYALSREPAARAAPSSSFGNRKPITLSTKPLSAITPLDDEVDEDFAEYARAVTA